MCLAKFLDTLVKSFFPYSFDGNLCFRHVTIAELTYANFLSSFLQSYVRYSRRERKIFRFRNDLSVKG